MSRDVSLRDNSPVIVAEVSANHRGSLESALALIRAIAATGATHVKFQTYTADTITLNCSSERFRISSDHSLWGGRTLYSLYSEAHTPWDWHAELFRVSREAGLIPFSSPFDETAVDFLEGLNPSLYKIASMEIGDVNLVKYIASMRRPMVISTGAASMSEVDNAVNAALSGGCDDLILLLCTSSYPTTPEDVHLARMETLRERYGVPVGLSDHTKGIGVSIAAAALGACMIERHVTLRRSDGGPDAAFSLEPVELSTLVSSVNAAAQAIGNSYWQVIPVEAEARRLKRSLYVTEDCFAGDFVTRHNVRSIRPSGGMDPALLEFVVGKRFTRDVARGTPLSADCLSD